MSNLQINLEQILQEKTTKILPENIKKDVQIFDVVGTLESGGVMTQEDYDTCDTIADEILGNTKPYTELEYIENTGTQYIITDVNYSSANTYKIEAEIAYMSFPTRENDSLIGWDAGGAFGINSDGKLFNGSKSGTTAVSAGAYNLFTLTIDKGTSTLVWGNDSVSRPNSNMASYAISGYPVFALVTNSGAVATKFSIRIKSYKIYVDNILYCDLIPVKTSSNVICMYDKVTKTFLENQGTGYFIAGGEI